MRPREAREICRVIPVALLSLPAFLFSCEETRRGPVFLTTDTRVELGLGGVHVENDRNTLFVELKNRGTTFDGTIEIMGDLSGVNGAVIEPDPVTYRTRIEIPGALHTGSALGICGVRLGFRTQSGPLQHSSRSLQYAEEVNRRFDATYSHP